MLLSTVHRAKGLEFAHVFILDGAWPDVRGSQYSTDVEEERRIYYVAMTRAAETLTLFRRKDLNSLFPREVDAGGVLTRRVLPLDICNESNWMHRKFCILGPAHFFLGFAGRKPAQDPIHARLAVLEQGDELSLYVQGEYSFLRDKAGNTVARLSQSGHTRMSQIDKVIRVRVLAILVRKREDEGDGFADQILTDQWEIPFCEVMYC